MSQCYICGRDSEARCSECRKDVCKAHIEDEITKDDDLLVICSSCNRKRKLKRIRTYTVVGFLVLVALIVLGVVFSSLSLFG